MRRGRAASGACAARIPTTGTPPTATTTTTTLASVAATAHRMATAAAAHRPGTAARSMAATVTVTVVVGCSTCASQLGDPARRTTIARIAAERTPVGAEPQPPAERATWQHGHCQHLIAFCSVFVFVCGEGRFCLVNNKEPRAPGAAPNSRHRMPPPKKHNASSRKPQRPFPHPGRGKRSDACARLAVHSGGLLPFFWCAEMKRLSNRFKT